MDFKTFLFFELRLDSGLNIFQENMKINKYIHKGICFIHNLIQPFCLFSFFNQRESNIPIYIPPTVCFPQLLVQSTLVQGSTSHVTKTAYLKLIDYWNMLSLAVTLINFFTLILWEIWFYNEASINWKKIKYYMRILSFRQLW